MTKTFTRFCPFDQAKEFVTHSVNAQRAANKLCHQNDPDTSREAAEKMVKSGALSRQEQEVLNAIKTYLNRHPLGAGQTWKMKREDFTAKEINYYRGINYYTIQRRLSSLCDKGKIERIQATNNGELLFNKKDKPIYKKRDGCCTWRLI